MNEIFILRNIYNFYNNESDKHESIKTKIQFETNKSNINKNPDLKNKIEKVNQRIETYFSDTEVSLKYKELWIKIIPETYQSIQDYIIPEENFKDEGVIGKY